MEERLQKLLSAAGLCSRRSAEDYIEAGRVTVNGRLAKLGDKADLSRDRVALDGVEVGPAVDPVYLMLNKPRGYVTTLSDEEWPTAVFGYGRWGGWTWTPKGCSFSPMMESLPIISSIPAMRWTNST